MRSLPISTCAGFPPTPGVTRHNDGCAPGWYSRIITCRSFSRSVGFPFNPNPTTRSPGSRTGPPDVPSHPRWLNSKSRKNVPSFLVRSIPNTSQKSSGFSVPRSPGRIAQARIVVSSFWFGPTTPGTTDHPSGCSNFPSGLNVLGSVSPFEFGSAMSTPGGNDTVSQSYTPP